MQVDNICYASLQAIRSVKTNDEIKKMQIAANIAATAINSLKKEISIGWTERKAANFLTNYMLSKKATKNSFDLIVAFGENSAKPHHIVTDRKLKANDIILVDIGCVYEGYCSDISRTFCLSPVNKKLQEAYDVVKLAQQVAIEKIKVGMKTSDVHKICEEIINKTKFKNLFIHSTGHGVGIEIHEAPYLNSTSATLLQENMVVTIEPGIYIENLGGIRIEDTIVIKKK